MTVDIAPIQRFLAQVARMAQLKQTDLRLSLAEAAALCASLGGLLAVANAVPVAVVPSEPVVDRAVITPARVPPVGVIFDGGGFTR